MNALDANSPDSIVHIITLSLSPIFLLTAVASLLGVFTTRLARISDQVKLLVGEVDVTREQDQTTKLRLAYLKRRSHALDVAVILAALAGACTCGTVLALFLAFIRVRATTGVLFGLFGAAILCTIGALGAFLFEVLVASRGIRASVALRIGRFDW